MLETSPLSSCAITLAASFIAGVFYLAIVRPWQLRWGATREEAAVAMPGDAIVARPTFVATHADNVMMRKCMLGIKERAEAMTR